MVFNTIEIGSILNYNYSNISIGFGGKFNYLLKSIYSYPSFEKDDDRSNWFTNYSYNLGIGISYTINRIVINFESWFGISNLAGNDILPSAKIRENNYRLLLGYRL